MERKAYQNLLKWKNRKNRKPLIVSGVRQCGKTYIIRDEFGKREFSDVAYFNFDGDNRDGCTHVWSLPLYAFYRFREYVSEEFGW